MKRYCICSLLLFTLFSLNSLQAQTVDTETTGTVNGIAYSTAQIIQGQVSGVSVRSIDGNPNGALLTNIRGLNSLRGDSQPLWIVDGAELNSSLPQNLNAFWQDRFGDKGYLSPVNELDFLSPYQIESIQVIKDVSATALYGAKGAHGVIVIKTKKAADKEGRELRWNSNFGLNTPASGYGKVTVSHNHTFLLAQNRKQTNYSLSAFFRENQGVIADLPGYYASLKANFETTANPVVHFGLNTIANLGRTQSTLGTAGYGELSETLTIRYPDMTTPEGLDGKNSWASDYSDKVESYRSISSVFLNLNFFPGFSLKTKGGIDYEYQDRYVWYDNATSMGSKFNGAAAVPSTSLMNYNASALLNFDRFIYNAHILGIKAGVDVEGGRYKYGIMNATDFFSHSLGAKGISYGGSKKEPNNFTQEAMQLSILAQITYSFKGIINLEGNVRAGTTPKYDEGKFTIYPSVNLSANLHKAFMPQLETLSTLSVRGGYGVSGRERYIPTAQYMNYTGGKEHNIAKDIEVYFDSFNRVTSSEWHADLDFGFAKDRVKGSFRYYDKRSEDVLNLYDNSKVKKTTTSETILDFGQRKEIRHNVAEIGNRGFELDINAAIIKQRAFDLNVYANAAYNVNQVLRIDADEQYSPGIGGGITANVNAPGQAVSSLYGYRLNSDGSFRDLTGEGKISPADREVLGNPVPKTFGSLGASLRIINFNVDLRFDGASGFKILNMNSMLADQATEVTEKYVSDGDYIRLANLGVSYKLPFSKGGLKGITLRLSAHNLFTASKYKGWNPDVNSFGINNLTQGADYGSYPVTRTFVFGVQFNF